MICVTVVAPLNDASVMSSQSPTSGHQFRTPGLARHTSLHLHAPDIGRRSRRCCWSLPCRRHLTARGLESRSEQIDHPLKNRNNAIASSITDAVTHTRKARVSPPTSLCAFSRTYLWLVTLAGSTACPSRAQSAQDIAS